MDPLLSMFGSESDAEMDEKNSLSKRGDLWSETMCLPPECEEGNIEYKLKLVNPSQSRFEHLVTQMKWRLREGIGLLWMSLVVISISLNVKFVR